MIEPHTISANSKSSGLARPSAPPLPPWLLLAENQRLRSEKLLKLGVWVYFFLLIFEGALRKWFLPGLAAPLLIIRDPVALWVIIMAVNKGILKPNAYIVLMFIVSIVAFIAALLFGHGNILVALFGLRILVIHFPFMFAIGKIFTRDDVLRLGRITLWLAIPMALLIGLQFYSPQGSWVNRGVGGDESGAGFSGALGFFRPPGTFSFATGSTMFFGLVSLFVFYFLLHSNKINRIILIGATVALIASIPLSISRTLIFTVAVCGIFMVGALLRQPKYIGKTMIGFLGVCVLLAALSQLHFFQTAMEALVSRFVSADSIEGGLQGTLGDRYLQGMLSAITNSTQLPFFGYGLGMGTNVGASLLTGSTSFLISEQEWGRLIGEMGLLLGLSVIILRVSICFKWLVLAYRKLAENDMLPWMLISFTLTVVPQGQWAQPNALGFSTLAGGLVMAALNYK
jgi:hypothetical protein